jgi:hypothetical protein
VRYVNGTSYRVVITLYRDTTGIPMAPSQVLWVKGTPRNGGPATQQTYSVNNTSKSTIMNLNYGAEAYVFDTVITLNYGTNYRLGLRDCCRNAAIQNIATPGGTFIYIQTDFQTPDTIGSPANSSPSFYCEPVQFLQNGQAWVHNPLGYDPDGDSISFELMGTYSDSGQVNTSYSQPAFTMGDSLDVNPNTGELTWTPSNNGNYVFSYVINEYRNGVKIGSVLRDYQCVVGNNVVVIPNLVAASPAMSNVALDTLGGILTATFNPSQVGAITFGGSTGNSEAIYTKFYGKAIVEGSATGNFVSLNGMFNSTLVWTPDPLVTPKWTAIHRTVVKKDNRYFCQDYTFKLQARAVATSVNNAKAISSTVLYPNPSTRGASELNFEMNNAGNLTIDIVDISGRSIKTYPMGHKPAGVVYFSLNENLSPGMYLIRINLNGETAQTLRWSIQ